LKGSGNAIEAPDYPTRRRSRSFKINSEGT